MAADESDNDKTQTHVVLIKDTMVSHYRISKKIGAGGMGEVYLAEDTKLNRQVALKFLATHLTTNPDTRTRFVREAQAAAKLDHPNIVTIYEVGEFIGQPFFSMQFIKGKTLLDCQKDEVLPITKVIEIIAQIADGLGKAHSVGITHRDIKSANIVLDDDLRPRILDFGLAAIQGAEMLTQAGTTMGTVAYMSPEQAQGQKVDHRSDIYSLGVVLYELITGKPPLKRDQDAATLNAIANEQPEPLARFKNDVPPDLERIVARCLAKSVNERYQTADDFAADLRFLSSSLKSGASDRSVEIADAHPSIAVLPFSNMSADPENEFFSDGLSEELLNVLAKNPGLRVTGRTSSFAFKGKQEDLREIGQKLGVGTILEGSVRKSGNRVRITAQLVKVSDGFHLWSETYDRVLEDIFAVQDDIATAVSKALQVTLLGGSNTKQVINPESYELSLRGMQFLLDLNKSAVDDAAALFQKAIDLDSKNAMAWTGLARINTISAAFGYGDTHTIDLYRTAKEQIYKALELDDTLPDSYVVLGWIKNAFEFQFDEASAAFQKAYDLAPNNCRAVASISLFKGILGDFSESIRLGKKAVELDPLNAEAYMNYGKVLLWAGNYPESITIFEHALKLGPGMSSVNLSLCWSHLLQDDFEKALRVIEVESAAGYRNCGLTMVFHAMGRKEDSDKALAELLKSGNEWAYQFATAYGYRNEIDKAFEWMDISIQLRDAGTSIAKVSPFFKNLHSDPRWPKLLKRIGFSS